MSKKALSESDFDMKPMLRWCEKEQNRLLDMIPNGNRSDEKMPIPLRGTRFLQLTRSDLTALWFLFPETARKRSVLRRIEGRPATWFHNCALIDGLFPTEDPEQAFSPSAIIASSQHFVRRRETSILANCIRLHFIHTLAYPAPVQHIVHSQDFVNRVAQSIIIPALFQDNYVLTCSNGARIEGRDWLISVFGHTAQDYSSISHDAGTYRNCDGSFKKNEYGCADIAIAKELTDCITAYLLGFVFCRELEAKRRLNPFRNRPKIKQLVCDFLHAEHIPTTASTAEST